jgi:hypothetical protein
VGLFAFRVCALAATALSLLGAAALQRTGVAQSRPPNIVFILADDLGIANSSALAKLCMT